ncbi:MAG: YwmB family TATA-box binding protein [Bacillota bacterium]|nr:YwmB family TATA-box binding protein [Bacillota bacterium]
MKKGFFLVIVLGALLAFFLPGETSGNREKPVLPELVALVERGGGGVDGFDLEGWAVVKRRGEVEKIWKDLDLTGSLELQDGRLSPVQSSQGKAICYQGRPAEGAEVRITLQKVGQAGPQDLTYLMLKARIPSGTRTALAWEEKLRETLAAAGSEHGLYLTVKGRIPRKLGREAQLAWGEAVLQELGGSVADSLRTEKYLSLVGYTPVFFDAVRVGKKKVNINVALVSQAGSEETLVYLGTPLISSEY